MRNCHPLKHLVSLRLTAALPPSERARNWLLLYGSARDGASCSTLLWRATRTPHASILIVIEDTWGHIFGGFAAGVSLHDSARYAAEAGASWVFALRPEGLRKWGWSGANDYVLLVNETCLAMGGGDEGFAFHLDDELDQVRSPR